MAVYSSTSSSDYVCVLAGIFAELTDFKEPDYLTGLNDALFDLKKHERYREILKEVQVEKYKTGYCSRQVDTTISLLLASGILERDAEKRNLYRVRDKQRANLKRRVKEKLGSSNSKLIRDMSNELKGRLNTEY